MIVVDALRRNDTLGEFMERMDDTFFQIKFIQRKFRALREIMKQRRHALRYNILMQQTFLINNSLLKTQSKENENLSLMINGLSDSKKDFIADCFIYLAKFDFRI